MSNLAIVPSGIVEYTPQEFLQFVALRELVSSVYKSFGYTPLETSSIQYLDVLSSAGEIAKEVYAIVRAKAEEAGEESNRGLRFDLTKPLARYVAQHQNELVFPFRRSEIGLVYRGERPQKGRQRQLYQADFDIIGREVLSLEYDAEMIDVAAHIFEKLGLKTIIRLNNRKLLQAILETYGVHGEQFSHVLSVIDKYEKTGRDKALQLLADVGIDKNNCVKILELVSQKVSLSSVSEFLAEFPTSEAMNSIQQEVALVTGLVTKNYSYVDLVFDMSIVRGLEYYTGTVFETNLVGYEYYGSVCSGGRYDNLVKDFSSQSFPGVGGSVGLSRLFTIILEEKLDVTLSMPRTKQIYIAIVDPSRTRLSKEYSQSLRREGNVVIVSSSDIKLKKQFEIASKLSVDEVHIIEENHSVTIKNMTTGEQKTVQLSE